VNGPVFTVPNGLDTQELPGRTVGAGRNIKVFIGGLKNPGLASKLAQALNRAGISVHLETSFLPRAKFVQRLGSAEIAVLLPHRTEGFFLPALEAMALGAIVVCPDCVGNRSFCKDGDNCFAPSYKVEQILEAVMRALRLPREARTRMISAASETVALHSLAQERDRFLDILRNSNHMW
jgi:glycosyltransferase involved in cell wall biosynthesis